MAGIGRITATVKNLLEDLGITSGGVFAGGGTSIVSGTAIVSGCPPGCSASPLLTTAAVGERIIYWPRGGTLTSGLPSMTFAAPAAPSLGDRWGLKNRSDDVQDVIVSGNGNDIEDPLASYAVAATFTLSGDGISVEWEFDGTQWLVV